MCRLRPSFAAALLALVVGCSAPPPPPLLRIGYSPHDHHAPLYVAALAAGDLAAAGAPRLVPGTAEGEFALAQGPRTLARVRLFPNPGGKEMIRKLAEDQVDLAFGGFPAMVQQIDKGAPIRIVAPVMSGGAGLVVRRDLSVRTWEEFVRLAGARARPLRIGHRIDASVQSLLFQQALAASGVPFASDLDRAGARVVLVNLYGAENLVPALESGAVDGFLGVQPVLAQAEVQGIGRLLEEELPCEPGGDCGAGAECVSPCCALAARTAFASAHPEALAGAVAMVRAASRWIAGHPTEAPDLVARWLGTSPVVERRSLPTIRFTTEFDRSWKEGARRWVALMVRDGTLKGRVAEALREGTLDEVLHGSAPPASAAGGR